MILWHVTWPLDSKAWRFKRERGREVECGLPSGTSELEELAMAPSQCSCMARCRGHRLSSSGWSRKAGTLKQRSLLRNGRGVASGGAPPLLLCLSRLGGTTNIGLRAWPPPFFYVAQRYGSPLIIISWTPPIKTPSGRMWPTRSDQPNIMACHLTSWFKGMKNEFWRVVNRSISHRNDLNFERLRVKKTLPRAFTLLWQAI